MAHTSTADHNNNHHGTGAHHSPMYYVRIWAILLVLLIISIVGPMFEIKVVTLITAFGIAVVKAMMVAAYFMHLNVEKKYIWFMLYSMLILILVMFVGVSADVLKVEGQRWENTSAKELIKQHEHHDGQTDSHSKDSGQH